MSNLLIDNIFAVFGGTVEFLMVLTTCSLLGRYVQTKDDMHFGM